MKTAVSIPDEIFARADRLADARGMSRSRLYAEALREYLARHDPDSLTAAVNRVVDALGDGRDDFVRAAGLHSLRRTEW
jgi:metal-responsive CopG/Arc/MetJ family transcriptional regulator